MQSGNSIENAVLRTIREHDLLRKGDRVLAGLSGGADSMCLVHVLHALSEQLGIEVAAAHMNHNIRGGAALHDARVSEEFAKRLGIRFFYRSEEVCEYAKRNSLSEELAGRELRYRFFNELCSEYGYNRIATAHNKNDNAETLLMNFIRGSGLSGLCGIPVTRGNIIRPILEISRARIEEYCAENGLDYVTDSTNLETVYTRNKVRLGLIPEIQKSFNPNFVNTATANARLIGEENDFIENEAKKAYKAACEADGISAAAIAGLHKAIARRVILMILDERLGGVSDVGSKIIDDVLSLCVKGMTGKRINIPRGFTAEVSYGRLVIQKRAGEAGEFSYALSPDTEVYIPELGIYASLEVCDARENDGAIYLSCDDISAVGIRSRRAGDVFCPVGMSGRRKLKEYFIDKKIPSQERSKIPLVTVGEDIAAVSGMRTDKRYVFGKNSVNFKIVLRR